MGNDGDSCGDDDGCNNDNKCDGDVDIYEENVDYDDIILRRATYFHISSRNYDIN